jgi:hypothetical protein
VSRRPPTEAPVWEFLGILSLFDPPRPDTKKTIEQAIANGVLVKMVTGDHQVRCRAAVPLDSAPAGLCCSRHTADISARLGHVCVFKRASSPVPSCCLFILAHPALAPQVIAKETCRELGMGTNILNPETLNDKSMTADQLREIIFNAHGAFCCSAAWFC